jgi:hypothetical protein
VKIVILAMTKYIFSNTPPFRVLERKNVVITTNVIIKREAKLET